MWLQESLWLPRKFDVYFHLSQKPESCDRTLKRTLGDNRRHESGSRGETFHAPTAVVPGRALDAKDLRRLAGRERDIETVERMIKAVTKRLDEGFLARPAVEKSQRPVARIERKVTLVLATGEKACRDVVGVADDANGFNVDADFASGREGVHGDIIGMRYVESQVRARVSSRKRRFAAFPVHQLDRSRPNIQP